MVWWEWERRHKHVLLVCYFCRSLLSLVRKEWSNFEGKTSHPKACFRTRLLFRSLVLGSWFSFSSLFGPIYKETGELFWINGLVSFCWLLVPYFFCPRRMAIYHNCIFWVLWNSFPRFMPILVCYLFLKASKGNLIWFGWIYGYGILEGGLGTRVRSVAMWLRGHMFKSWN